MKLSIDSFKGEIPRLTPRALPANCAQESTNCRLETGDLMAFRQFVSVKTLAAAAQTIYKLNGAWLSWNAQVDVARGLIPGDTNFFTFLTAPSLYATPRYTTYTLATTGAEPYPVTTYPLGMPAPTVAPTLVVGVDPTATTFSVDITDDGSTLASNWTISGTIDEFDHSSSVTQDAVLGNPAPSYRVDFENNNADPAYAYRNFGIAGAAAVTMEFDFYIDSTFPSGGIEVEVGVATDIVGAGLRVSIFYNISNPSLCILTGSSWGVESVLSSVALGGAILQDNWYTMVITKTVNEDASSTVVATLFNGVTQVQTLTATGNFTDGDYCALLGLTEDEHKSVLFDNIHVTASGSNGVTIVNLATAYVYTFVNDNVGGTGADWEGAPSPASGTILRPDGVSVTVTTATTHAFDAGYGINKKRIYRVVSGASGDIYMLVAEIALATADYVDVLDDSEISNPGTPLATADFDLPPDDLEGIIALPNNCMCGFSKNQLCFSAVGYPYAWPVRYRLPTDTDIVAIKNIDNTVVLGTEAFVYTAAGTEPGNYAMSKPGAAQACVSKLGMVYLDNFGVVFPSPDGWQVCSGSAANVRNATEGVFTKEQWEALTPSSILAAVYDGTLYFWFSGSTPDAGYMLDTRPGGMGLVRLSHHAKCAYVDPLTDSMFMILDVNSEPTDADLPTPSTAVTPTTTAIFQWDAHASAKIVYRYKGKLNLMPYASTFHFAKIKGQDFTNVLSRVYADGALLHEKVAANQLPYRIPGLATYSTMEQEIMGTSRIRTHQIAQEIEEFD